MKPENSFSNLNPGSFDAFPGVQNVFEEAAKKIQYLKHRKINMVMFDPENPDLDDGIIFHSELTQIGEITGMGFGFSIRMYP